MNTADITKNSQTDFRAGNSGYTLPEMLTALTIFLLLIGGMLSAHIFGLRMFQINQNKLLASDTTRKAVNRLADEVRSCSSTYVGNVTNGVFTGKNNGEVESGGALLIYPTGGATNYILYFLNSADQSFRRMNSLIGSTTVLVKSVTNTTVFSVQDCFGNILTNNQNNRVIHCDLVVYRSSTTNPVADYFKMETSVTRRSLN